MSNRRCDWCSTPLIGLHPCARFCSKKCRQTAFRCRRRRTTAATAAERGLAFKYADPPYPGCARKYYGDQPDFDGEVDHPALIASLEADRLSGAIAGWALSTSEEALRDLLPLCPPPPVTHTAAWVKPIGPSQQTFGPHNCWEPVIIVGGRRMRPGVRDWLQAQPARFGGDLPGRKPIAFCVWLFELLGMLPGDSIVDLFPGTGVVSRSWAELSSAAAVEVSSGDDEDTSSEPVGDASSRPASATGWETSLEYSDDANMTALVHDFVDMINSSPKREAEECTR